LPLGEATSKHKAQELLHAVEELYFYRRYDEAVAFVQRVLSKPTGSHGLDGDVEDLLRYYERKCLDKVGK
jgi:hypothetical protein